jgi:flagellar basal body-associated protein FliL
MSAIIIIIIIVIIIIIIIMFIIYAMHVRADLWSTIVDLISIGRAGRGRATVLHFTPSQAASQPHTFMHSERNPLGTVITILLVIIHFVSYKHVYPSTLTPLFS